VNVGGGDLAMGHGYSDLVQPGHDIARRIDTGHGCTLVIRGHNPAIPVELSAGRPGQPAARRIARTRTDRRKPPRGCVAKCHRDMAVTERDMFERRFDLRHIGGLQLLDRIRLQVHRLARRQQGQIIGIAAQKQRLGCGTGARTNDGHRLIGQLKGITDRTLADLALTSSDREPFAASPLIPRAEGVITCHDPSGRVI